MSVIAQLRAVSPERVALLSGRRERLVVEVKKWDNRPAWENKQPKWDNRPSWDNWGKRWDKKK